ncbi:MAG TPA: hypothetical protein VJI46_02045 [Candidatus Nanoarchaeia archaeon]|nr:hypothetical protein [Candidatus Nanoarchaeia archaeon]
MATKLWAIIIVILATILTSSGQLLYKLGSESLDFAALNISPYLILGFILYLGAGIMVLFSMKGGELSVIYPFIALSFIWVSLLSTYFLNETMNTFKWVGVAVIISGISFIGIGSKVSENAN